MTKLNRNLKNKLILIFTVNFTKINYLQKFYKNLTILKKIINNRNNI